MSLDIVVLGVDGRPEREVAIGVNLHARLMQLVRERELPLLQRLSDYYEDATFEREELEALEAEVDKILADCSGDDELHGALFGVRDLARFARAEHRGLEALAD